MEHQQNQQQTTQYMANLNQLQHIDVDQPDLMHNIDYLSISELHTPIIDSGGSGAPSATLTRPLKPTNNNGANLNIIQNYQSMDQFQSQSKQPSICNFHKGINKNNK